MDVMTMVIRMVLSGVLAGLIGFEREWHGRPAGFRTHMLVCIGSTLFTIVSILMAQAYSNIGASDPARIASNIVTGIGFLGAGAIIRGDASIQGLTTAASIWAVAAIGMAVGVGLYTIAVITTVIVLIVLFLSKFERHLELKDDNGNNGKNRK